MNKVILLISLICLVGGLVLTGSGCQEARRGISGVMPYHEEHFVVPEGMHAIVLPVELSDGDCLEGSVQEITGDYEVFVFWVTDPNGQTIHQANLKGKHDFVFKATVDGYYALQFTSLRYDKQVVLKYRRT